MGEQQFKDAATRITGLFETCGAAAAVAEQERVNQTLKPKNLYIRFEGRPGGRHLAFRLYRSDTRPHQVILDLNMWLKPV
ncbi:MAG: hypothetical protein JOZ31_21615 [Verrucomicrobia bacterium]|nr:hypothetical protein [Verrucomicrobiota bacterium]MBV8483126.1 hypothetical protein [Verrucomicrobiota bacterium]